jgi:hypothetical protein
MESIRTITDAAASGYFSYESIQRLYSYSRVHLRNQIKTGKSSVFEIKMGVVQTKRNVIFNVVCEDGDARLSFCKYENVEISNKKITIVPKYFNTGCDECMFEYVESCCPCGISNYCSPVCQQAHAPMHAFFCSCVQRLPKNEPSIYQQKTVDFVHS